MGRKKVATAARARTFPRALGRSSRLSKRQREAVYAAHLDDLNGREIAEAAAAGDLGYPPLPPFEISDSYARQLARNMAAERGELYRVSVDLSAPRDALEAITKKQIALADKETTRLEKKQQQGRMNGQELDRLVRATASAARLLQTLDSRPRKPPADKPEPDAPEPEKPGDDWVSDALADDDAPDLSAFPVADGVVRESAQKVGRPSDPHEPAPRDAPTDKGADIASEIRRAADGARERQTA